MPGARRNSRTTRAVRLPYLGIAPYVTWVEIVFHAAPGPHLSVPSSIFGDVYLLSMLITVVACGALALLPTRTSATAGGWRRDSGCGG